MAAAPRLTSMSATSDWLYSLFDVQAQLLAEAPVAQILVGADRGRRHVLVERIGVDAQAQAPPGAARSVVVAGHLTAQRGAARSSSTPPAARARLARSVVTRRSPGSRRLRCASAGRARGCPPRSWTVTSRSLSNGEDLLVAVLRAAVVDDDVVRSPAGGQDRERQAGDDDEDRGGDEQAAATGQESGHEAR